MNDTTQPARPSKPIRLGLRENLAQFLLLVGVNALVGGMIGQERTVLPLLAKEEFGLTAFSSTLTFICLLYTSPSPRDRTRSRMPSSA